MARAMGARKEGGREGARASGYAVQGRPFWNGVPGSKLSSLSGGQLTSLWKGSVLSAQCNGLHVAGSGCILSFNTSKR